MFFEVTIPKRIYPYPSNYNIIYIYMRTVVKDMMHDAFLKLMSWISFIGQVIGITREAVQSNLWGIACPFHCQGSSFPHLALSFILGSLLGSLLTILFTLWIFFLPSPRSNTPDPPVRVLGQHLRRRLEGYRPLLDERS